jgi:predicted RNase H-like HicB family nuclease
MALDITNVQAGELITASLVNELIGELEKLDVRVTTLEQAGSTAGQVEIDAVYPQPVRATTDLTIIGKNFGVSVGATRVRFNGVSPTTFRNGSNDNTLICDVPEVPGLVEAGSTVELTVANARSAATTTVTVLPAERDQVGDADMVFAGVTPDPTIAGQNADYAFTLHSDALLPAKMSFSVLVAGAGGPLGWTTSFLDAIKNPIADRTISINRNETKAFFVRIALPTGSEGVPFTLKVDAFGGGLTASSGTQFLTVGVGATPDPAIPDLSPITVINGTLDGSTVTVKPGEFADVNVEVHFTEVATYNVQFAPATGTSGWSADLLVPSPDLPRFNIATGDLSETGPPKYAREVITVSVGPTSNTSPRGKAVLTVQRQGETSKRTYTFDLVVG